LLASIQSMLSSLLKTIFTHLMSGVFYKNSFVVSRTSPMLSPTNL